MESVDAQIEAEENEEFFELLLSLSSSYRYSILSELRRQNSMKMQEIAKKLGMTATEAFRQLQRLTDAKLIQRMPDGSYTITQYALYALELSASFDFVSRHREYFLNHYSEHLPYQFLNRLGELSTGILETDVVTCLNNTTTVIGNAEQELCIYSNKALDAHVDVARGLLSKGVKLRYIFQESLLTEMRPLTGAKILPEIRIVPKVCGIMILTEKEALFALQGVGGKTEYIGFSGNDSKFMGWARDLFEYFWERAKPWSPHTHTHTDQSPP